MMKEKLKQALWSFDKKFETDVYLTMLNLISGNHWAGYRFSKEQIAFVHIPKTGGSSLHALLKEKRPNQFVNIGKHRPVSKHCPPGKYHYMTIIRNPENRVWSRYQMVLRGDPFYVHKPFAEKGLHYYLTHSWEVRNMMCRYLSGNIGEEPTEKTLETAYENLMKFDIVLEFDNYATELNRFLENYGIHKDGNLPHEKKATYSESSPEETELILKYNRLDLELYNRWKQSNHSDVK
jgi:hypothetical protein